MSDFWSTFGDRRYTTRQMDDLGAAFNDAANLATGAITARTDAVLAQIEQGAISASVGNSVVAALAQLRSEMETDFRRYWNPDSDN